MKPEPEKKDNVLTEWGFHKNPEEFKKPGNIRDGKMRERKSIKRELLKKMSQSRNG